MLKALFLFEAVIALDAMKLEIVGLQVVSFAANRKR